MPQTWEFVPMRPLLDVIDARDDVADACKALRDVFEAFHIVNSGRSIALQGRVALLGDWAFSRVESQGHIALAWKQPDAIEDYYSLILSSSGASSAESGAQLAAQREGGLYTGTMLPSLLKLSGTARHLIVFVPVNALRPEAATGRPFAIDWGGGAVLTAMVRTLEAQASAGATTGLAAMLPILAQLIDTVVAVPPTAALRSPRRTAIGERGRITDYVELHIDDAALDARMTARDCGLSLRRLHRLFSGSGESFGTMVRRLRLERAVALLSNDNYSISEIALRSGFADSAYFASAFRHAYDQSPTQWRKQHL